MSPPPEARPIAAEWGGDVRFALRELALRVIGVLPGMPVPLGWAGGLEAIAAFARAVPPVPRPGTFTQLVRRLALSPIEQLVLVAAASPELDVRFASAWQLLGNRIDAMRPRVTHLLQLVTAAEQRDVLAILDPAHVLRVLGLVTLEGDHVIVAGGALLGVLTGDDVEARALGIELGAARPIDRAFPAALQRAIAAPIGRAVPGDRPTAICLEGPRGSGRGQLACDLAATAGRSTAWLRLDEHTPRAAVGALARVALCEDVVPCIELAGELPIAALLAPLASVIRGPWIVLAESRVELSAAWQAIAHPTMRPDAAARRALWRTALGAHHDTLAGELARRFPLGVGAILRAADDARARSGETISGDALAQAAREQLERRSSVAERIRTQRKLDELVAPAQTLALIEEVIAFARHRRKVFDDWGFAKRMHGGLKVLFSGPPGTGKTMSAEIIAAELDLDLFRIDLSNVVSKWVGETEKNLKQVFDQAEASGGVLLFDEADSLFGKRTADVKSSSDRYANLEVNYLLQRMEAFDGIVLLTTNLESGIDEAFRRRLNFRVRFSAPDADERERLWQGMIPAQVPRTQLDFSAIAERFDMAGGNIKNAALRAAILAASENAALSQRHLLAAAEREFAEIGRIGR